VLILSEKFIYNPNSVWINKISKRFLCVLVHSAQMSVFLWHFFRIFYYVCLLTIEYCEVAFLIKHVRFRPVLEKVKPIRPIAVRETNASRCNGDPLKNPLKTLRPSKHYRFEGFKGPYYAERHASLSDSFMCDCRSYSCQINPFMPTVPTFAVRETIVLPEHYPL